MKRFLILSIILLAWAGGAWGSDTLGFLGTSTAGNYLCEDVMLTSDGGGNDNWGSDTYSGAGLVSSTTSHSLVRFPNLDDCATDSGVTAAEVDSGKIWLFTRNVPVGSAYILYKSVSVSWIEGTGTGAATDTVGASWLYRDTTLHTSWTTAGGDTNHVTFDSSSVTVDEAYVSFKISKASCSTWVATPASNYGINFYRTQTGSGYWQTSEGATAGERPWFTLYFTQGTPSTSMPIGATTLGAVKVGAR